MTQGSLLATRRFLVMSLPRWPTDCLKRRDPQLAHSAQPLALYEKQHGGMRLVALDAAASAAKLRLGQTVSDARAQLPGLELRELEPQLLAAVFADFADWHSYASPLVAVLADAAPWGDLALDITGVSHLFGGEADMLARVTGRLRQLGYSVTGAIAPSIGAAWALAHCGEQRLLEGDLAAALADYPMAALRLADSQLEALAQLGLKRIGQLYGHNRKALQARFGASLLTRLDQALGLVEERMTPRLPPVDRFVERRFAEPIGLLDDVLACAHDLAVSLGSRLEADGLGARSFHLLLYRVDHKVMRFSVNAGRPTRDPGHVARLFSHRAERLEGEYDAGFGIDMIRLAAGSTADLDAVQVGAFETDDGVHSLERLYDRMTSRLGPMAVLRQRFADTHIPERAVRLAPVIAETGTEPPAPPDAGLLRPLRLLVAPEPIEVIAQVPDGPPARMVWRRIGYRFVRASGPERIAAEWWRGTALPVLTATTEAAAAAADEAGDWFDETAAVRDYYIAEDDGGRRFWLFRQGLYSPQAAPRWFLHGFFA